MLSAKIKHAPLFLFWFSAAAAADMSNDSIMRGMADMFSLMTRQMGSGTTPGAFSPGMFPQGMPQGWPSAFNPQQAMPGWGQMPLPNGAHWPGTGGTGANLQGYWLGANGERLGFWQNKFQMQSAQGQSQGGQFALRGERALLLEVNGAVQPFEYAQQDDRLVLRDQYGQLFLYRRAKDTPWGGAP